MRKLNFCKTAYVFSVIALISIALNIGCTKQSVSLAPEQTVKAANSERSTSTNPKIISAEQMIEKSPDSPKGYTLLAVTYIQLARETGDFSLNTKAEAAINRSLEKNPDDLNSRKLQASLHLTYHRFSEALEAGKKLLQENPKDAFVYGVLTDANVELGNYDEAVENAQQMINLKPNMESYARVSYVRSLLGNTTGAINAMLTAASIADPTNKEGNAWCRVHLGNEYFKSGKYQAAEAAYDAALESLPEYHFALTGKGLARMAAGDYPNAIKFLEQAQARVPLTETIIALGDLYKKTGNQEKADEQYKLVEAIEQKLGLANDQRRLALFWADHDMKLDEALEIAAREHAARKDVGTADIYAWCLYKKGRFEEAKAIMKEATRIPDKDARIIYHSGMIERALNNKKETKNLLQKALQINPAFDLLQADNAKVALEELK